MLKNFPSGPVYVSEEEMSIPESQGMGKKIEWYTFVLLSCSKWMPRTKAVIFNLLVILVHQRPNSPLHDHTCLFLSHVI